MAKEISTRNKFGESDLEEPVLENQSTDAADSKIEKGERVIEKINKVPIPSGPQSKVTPA